MAARISRSNMEWEIGAGLLFARRLSENARIPLMGARTLNRWPPAQNAVHPLSTGSLRLGRPRRTLKGISESVVETVVGGSYPANAFGLHDVQGNVWEWVADCWNDSYFDAPSAGRAWMTGDCGQRAGQGGSWVNDAGTLRSVLRYSLETGHWSNGVGFRVARTIDP